MRGLQILYNNGSGGLILSIFGVENISIELKWNKYFNCSLKLVPVGSPEGRIISFWDLIQNRTSIKSLNALFACLNWYVDGDSIQSGWLASDYNARLAALYKQKSERALVLPEKDIISFTFPVKISVNLCIYATWSFQMQSIPT